MGEYVVCVADSVGLHVECCVMQGVHDDDDQRESNVVAKRRYFAVDGTRIPAESATCGGLAATLGDDSGDFANFEVSVDSQCVGLMVVLPVMLGLPGASHRWQVVVGG